MPTIAFRDEDAIIIIMKKTSMAYIISLYYNIMMGKEVVKFKLSICKFIAYYINPETLFLLGCMVNITLMEAV